MMKFTIIDKAMYITGVPLL